MADVVSREVRSRMMSGIKGANTKPEVQLRSLLHRRGFRFRLHAKELPGRPDLVLPKFRSVIFVNGCFWHGHDCRHFKWPKTRQDFWRQKIQANQIRDQKAALALASAGWKVCVVWECALKAPRIDEALVDSLALWLRDADRECHEISEASCT